MNKEILDKIEQGRQILYQIEHKESQMSSKELMEGLTFVKNLLIKPYFNENNEGNRIQYVIDLKDNLLQASSLLKGDDVNLIKEWLGTSYTITELIFKASKDGFTSSAFHSKCDGKGPNIVLVKAKSGQVFGAYVSVAWSSSGNYATDA